MGLKDRRLLGKMWRFFAWRVVVFSVILAHFLFLGAASFTSALLSRVPWALPRPSGMRNPALVAAMEMRRFWFLQFVSSLGSA